MDIMPASRTDTSRWTCGHSIMAMTIVRSGVGRLPSIPTHSPLVCPMRSHITRSGLFDPSSNASSRIAFFIAIQPRSLTAPKPCPVFAPNTIGRRGAARPLQGRNGRGTDGPPKRIFTVGLHVCQRLVRRVKVQLLQFI